MLQCIQAEEREFGNFFTWSPHSENSASILWTLFAGEELVG